MQNVDCVENEIMFDGSTLISETDTSGIITYVNRKFCEVMGYSKDELIGKPHNIIRHPDMPTLAFQELWNRINQGKRWSGYIKNLHKDGRFSWVIADIISVYNNEGKRTGYIATRRVPGKNLIEIKKQYKKFKDFELSSKS